MAAVSEGGAQTGFIISRRTGDISLITPWGALKLKRVARSSSTAELLEASDSADTLIYLQHLLAGIVYHHDTFLFVDYKSFLSLATFTRDPAQMCNKVDLASLRETFVPNGISVIGCLPGYYNISDELTKDNHTTVALLFRPLQEGVYPRHPETLLRHAEYPLVTEPIAFLPVGTQMDNKEVSERSHTASVKPTVTSSASKPDLRG